MISPASWAKAVNGRLSLRRGQLREEQLDEIKTVLDEQKFTDAKLEFAVNAVAVCLNEEHGYYDLLRHLLLHGHGYVDPACARPKTEREPLDWLFRALGALRDANAAAKYIGLPTIAEPPEWLAWTPEVEVADERVLAPKMVAHERGGGFASLGEILAGKQSEGPFNLASPQADENIAVLFRVLKPETIERLFSNGKEIVKRYKTRSA